MFMKPAKTKVAKRNKAMILLIPVTRFQPREFFRIDRSQIEFRNDGDMEVAGRIVHAGSTSLCPVRAMREWLAASPFTSGPLFPVLQRSGPPIALDYKHLRAILRRYAEIIGLNSAGISYGSLILGADMDFNATRALGL